MYAEFAAAAAAAVAPPAPIQATAALPFQPLHSMAQHSMAQHSMPLGAPLPLSQAPFSALLNPPAAPPSAQQLMQFHQAWTLWQTLLAQSQQPQGQSAGQGPSHQPSLGQLPHLPQLQQPMLLPPMQYQLPAQGRTRLVQQCVCAKLTAVKQASRGHQICHQPWLKGSSSGILSVWCDCDSMRENSDIVNWLQWSRRPCSSVCCAR